MKRVFSLMICVTLSVLLIILTLLSVSAAKADLSETGKTVSKYGDWMIEKINQGSQWELDEYTGSDEVVYAPRFYNGMLIVSFGDFCFMNNSIVKSVVTSSPLWSIGEYAFIDCISLESIELNFALDTIGVGAFSGTSSLKSINLEDTIVTEIKSNTFLNSGVEVIILPETCTSIGSYAFGQCIELTKIMIPDSVTEIADNAFEGCDSLVIYANSESYAIEYAVAHDIDYVMIDAPVEVTYMVGDADGDGKISILDATKIQRLLVQLVDDDGMIALRGDCDGDGCNILDATKIQRFLVSLNTTPAIGTTVTGSYIPNYS